MEEHMNPLAVTHLLQHTLRSLCSQENSQWIYAVFWRILPRNYPPPKWEGHGAYDRSRGNRRNWILVWEDGFCNFGASAASPAHDQINSSNAECPGGPSSVYGGDQFQHHQYYHGLQPELFFKMSHEIYNYGEGLIGKVAADHSHKWIYKEPNDQHQEINFLSAWHNSADSHPRTWEAQFQSGIKTIALIAVREGVVQLGAINKVVEDLSYVVLLRKKLSYIESIPGVLLPHPSSPSFSSFKLDPHGYGNIGAPPPDHHSHAWHDFQGMSTNATNLLVPPHPSTTHDQYYEHHFNMNRHQVPMLKNITPSMSSLEALLSKLPSVVPSLPNTTHDHNQFPESSHHQGGGAMRFMAPTEQKVVSTEETDVQEEEEYGEPDHKKVCGNVGESSTSMSAAYGRQQAQHYHHH
ncbi:hypothetical protein ACLB2K_036229 [Fragaria x ananassa]